MTAFHNAIIESGQESPYTEWIAKWDLNTPDVLERVTTRVECAEFFPQRDAALKAHATQIDPESRWFFMPLEMQQKLWSTEEYELARSLVDSTVPEDDLFAGLRERVSA